jgi:HlyD family secretion protein
MVDPRGVGAHACMWWSISVGGRPYRFVGGAYTPPVRRAPLALLAISISALSLTAAACEPSLDGIALDDVRRATVTEVVDVPASVTARAIATLTSPAEGTLASLTVQPGVSVAKDQVLAVIDSPAAQQRLAQAKSTLAAAGRIGYGFAPIDLSAVQDGLDAAAADSFTCAREAAAKISDDDLRAALLAQVDTAEARYRSAAATSRSLQRQVEQGLAGIGDAIGALGAAQRAQAQTAVDLAQSTVDALTLRAPIAGVVQIAPPSAAAVSDPLASIIGSVTGGAGAGGSGGDQAIGVDDVLTVGDRVSAGTAVLTIIDISEIGLVGEVDETDVLLVTPGITADVELDAAPGLRFEATVGTVDLLPTASTRGGVAYRIRLAFRAAEPGPGGQAPPTPRPGMSAVAHLHVRTAVDAVAVPAAAVFTADGGGAVWLVRDGRAVRQPVTVGVQGEDLVQIVTGLQPGERVVVTGTDKVTDGQDLT